MIPRELNPEWLLGARLRIAAYKSVVLFIIGITYGVGITAGLLRFGVWFLVVFFTSVALASFVAGCFIEIRRARHR